MAKKTQLLRLEPSDEVFNFTLFSIVCPYKSYRLAAQLNYDLDIKLSRMEDHSFLLRGEEHFFPSYLYQNLEGSITCRLIGNKVSNTLLLKELPFVDYLFTFQDTTGELNDGFLHRQLQNLPYIQWLKKENIQLLKSKSNLTFD